MSWYTVKTSFHPQLLYQASAWSYGYRNTDVDERVHLKMRSTGQSECLLHLSVDFRQVTVSLCTIVRTSAFWVAVVCDCCCTVGSRQCLMSSISFRMTSRCLEFQISKQTIVIIMSIHGSPMVRPLNAWCIVTRCCDFLVSLLFRLNVTDCGRQMHPRAMEPPRCLWLQGHCVVARRNGLQWCISKIVCLRLHAGKIHVLLCKLCLVRDFAMRLTCMWRAGRTGCTWTGISTWQPNQLWNERIRGKWSNS